MFATYVTGKPQLYTKKEANEKQGKAVVTRLAGNLVPAGTLGNVVGMTRSGSGFLLIVRWQLPDSDVSEHVGRKQYEKHFELPLPLQNTVAAMYLAMDLQRSFNDKELKQLSARLEPLTEPPDDLEDLLDLHSRIGDQIDVLLVACDLAINMDRGTERQWTERMTDILAKKLTLGQIGELRRELADQDESAGLSAEIRIVANACGLILASRPAN